MNERAVPKIYRFNITRIKRSEKIFFPYYLERTKRESKKETLNSVAENVSLRQIWAYGSLTTSRGVNKGVTE